jgi:hypothetical protein
MSYDSRTTELQSVTDPLTGLKWGKAIAAPKAITLDFDAVYQTEVSFTPLPENESIQLVTVEGVSDDAPFGLTNFTSSNYSTLPDEEGNFKFSSNPEDFGLEGEDIIDTFSGDGINKLFGNSSGSGSIDFDEGIVSGSGTITITGGKGIFKGATGTLTFEETETLADGTGTATVTGDITIPLPVGGFFVAGV